MAPTQPGVGQSSRPGVGQSDSGPHGGLSTKGWEEQRGPGALGQLGGGWFPLSGICATSIENYAAIPHSPPPRPLQASPPAVCSATVTCCFRSTSHSVVQGLPWLLTDPWAFPILTLTTQYHDCLVTCTHQCPAHGLRFNNY